MFSRRRPHTSTADSRQTLSAPALTQDATCWFLASRLLALPLDFGGLTRSVASHRYLRQKLVLAPFPTPGVEVAYAPIPRAPAISPSITFTSPDQKLARKELLKTQSHYSIIISIPETLRLTQQHFGRAAGVQMMILVGLLGRNCHCPVTTEQMRGQFLYDKMADLAQTSQLVVAGVRNLGDVMLHAQFRVKLDFPDGPLG